MTSPEVSVIMLTFNRERYIAEAIRSVLWQTFNDLELIIIDDGSTDRTAHIVREFDNDKIRYYQYSHSGIGSRLRNVGLEKSAGKFIAFIDSDDIWDHDKLQEQLKKLRHENTPAFVFTDVLEFSNDGTILKQGMYKKGFPEEGSIFQRYVTNEFAIYPSTILFDKRCLQLVNRFNEDFPWTDNEFFHRLAYHYRGFMIRQCLVNIRKHDSNTSSSADEGTVAEMQHMMKSFYEQRMIDKPTFRKMTAYYYYLGGMQYLRSKKFTLARLFFRRCVQCNPFHAKAMIRGTLTYFQS